MENNFVLSYSPQFYIDFELILFYIRYILQNDISANRLLIKVEREIKIRGQNPLGYKKYKTNKNTIYYRIYINNYIIFYTINNNIMEVRRIIYNKRNFENLL